MTGGGVPGIKGQHNKLTGHSSCGAVLFRGLLDMQTEFKLTTKQAEYIRNANHRWNVACGAVRSGKSYCQVSYCIPHRLVERKGLRGLRVILGATRANIERNILQPMRDVYGDGVASSINSQNFAKILGEKVYCIGADNIRQVAKIRGSEIAYCAIDEATDINEEVFEMLKSRLSLPWSCCDATTNPSYPSHWFKQFLDSAEHGVDIYCQDYTIYDNPFLPPDYVSALEAEYAGTVWYDRYILGEWTLAEGLIYPQYANAIQPVPGGNPTKRVLSIDYGTQNAFSAGLWGQYGDTWWREREYYYSGRDSGIQKTDEEYAKDLDRFTDGIGDDYAKLPVVIDPSAASFIALLRKRGKYRVIPADNSVADGIRETATAIHNDLIKVDPGCRNWLSEVQGYVWDDSDVEDRPVKVNDHAMDDMRYFVKTMRVAKPKSNYQSIYLR